MNKEFLQNLREQIKAGTVTEQEPMNKHTSFAIGGPADVFVQPATREEIRSAVYCAKEAGIPFFVMGNGSNLLVSDEGFRGMIIQIGKNFQEISVKDTVIEVQAGALLSRTARAAWNAGLTGFEFAAGHFLFALDYPQESLILRKSQDFLPGLRRRSCGLCGSTGEALSRGIAFCSQGR